MEAVVDWEPRLLLTKGANGFFKVAIRRHPNAVCWSWALEWNQNYRVVGFFGEKGATEQLAKTFPALETVKLAQSGSDWVAYRKDVRLAEEDDKLFYWKIDNKELGD
jgi:hypothetical protein